jgi:hypothetical protein
MFGGEVGVAHGHRQRDVTEDLLQRLKAAVPHDEPRGDMVATVVEVEVVELGLGNGVLERSADVAGRSHVASQQGELAIIPWLEFSMADARRGARMSDYVAGGRSIYGGTCSDAWPHAAPLDNPSRR